MVPVEFERRAAEAAAARLIHEDVRLVRDVDLFNEVSMRRQFADCLIAKAANTREKGSHVGLCIALR